MSVLRYAGITLPYPLSTSFSQEAVGDPQGDTDWHLVTYDIQVLTIINFDYAALLAPDLAPAATNNAADLMKVVYTRLMQRRQELSYTFNGVELIPQPQEGNDGIADAANGPKPVRCTYSRLNNVTFLVNYQIRASYWVNPNVTVAAPAGGNPGSVTLVNKPGNLVLSNRWSEEVELDQCDFSRRTREGTLVIRSDNVNGAIADQVRSTMAVVSVPRGFLRESSRYRVSPDGLSLQYRTVDVEKHKQPPTPAFKADGEYTETTTKMGALRFHECWIRLEGSKNTPQDQLVLAAVSTVNKKLRSRGAPIVAPIPPGTTLAVVDYSNLTVGMFDNWVRYHVRAMNMADANRLFGMASLGTGAGMGALLAPARMGDTGVALTQLVTTPNSNPEYTPAYQDRGTARLVLQAAAYYDPSLTGTTLQRNFGQLSTGFEPGQAGKDLE